MKSTYHLVAVFYFLLALIACVDAQGIDPVLSPPEDVTAAKYVNFSVYAIACAEGHKTVYLTNENNKAREVALSIVAIRGPFQASLDAKSNITLRTKKISKEGTVIYPPIAKIKFPVDIKEPLLILEPSTGDQPYKAFIIERSLKSFPMGSYLLMNLSSMKIRGHVGNTKVMVDEESVTSIIPSIGQEEFLDVHFEYKSPKRWRSFTQTRWANEKNKRSLLLAYLDAKTKRMRIRGIPFRLSDAREGN